tara:strand:- start:2784 stop:3491 length:708 start_codon:yes stop_codon:yes gene_type:complete
MNKKQQYFGLVTFPMISISIFVLFFLIAAFNFPGSEISHLNYKADRYSLSHNFLSSLGRIESSNGQTNLISCILFNGSLALIGITIVMFYKAFRELFFTIKDSPRSIILSNYAKPIGMISGLLFAGVGFVPHDLHHGAHVFFANYAFLSLFVLSILHSITVYSSKYISNIYAIGYLVFCIVLLVYVYLIFLGPKITPGTLFSEKDLMIQVVSQKLIVVSLIISMLIQVHGLKRLF